MGAFLLLDITPKTPADQEKLARALQVLAAGDGDLEVRPDAERNCTVIGATSEAHLGQIVDRLTREFEVEARWGRPTVAYLETLTRSAEGSAKHVRIGDGHAQYAHVSLRVHPAEPESGYSFEDVTIGGAIPKRFMASIASAIKEAMLTGVLHGYPMVDVRVEVHDGSYHETDSTDEAFRTAAVTAFLEAAEKAQPWLLEPVMQVVVRTTSQHVNVVLEDLLMRRGEIQGRTNERDRETITAHVPLAELFGFEEQARSPTHGYAFCSVRFAYYQPVVQGPDGGDDISRVGAPRRPAPHPRTSAASVREPDDDTTSC